MEMTRALNRALNRELSYRRSESDKTRLDDLYFDDSHDQSETLDQNTSDWHEMLTAPLFTSEVLDLTNSAPIPVVPQPPSSPFVAYGGLGRIVTQHSARFPPTPSRSIVYTNTNTPSSTFICGVQGSGKSHSISVLIENSLIASPELGRLPQPLSVVVFHLGAAQGGMHLPCESAFIGKMNRGDHQYRIPIKVLVSPSNLVTMRNSYAKTEAEVVPFYLSTKDLNCTRMMSLMRVDEGAKVPLYMEVVQQILRSMGNETFDYYAFKQNIEKKKNSEFTKEQNMPLQLRIQLLEAVLLECQKRKIKGIGSVKHHFEPGTVTIVDLTDPFINASSASALFDIALSLYLETEVPSGKLLVLDEAHKYLTNQSSAPFVDSVFSLIRQQRHLGTRIVIATQEPTVVPENMIGLCSTIICHRFSSPLWWKHLKGLIALDDKDSTVDWFDKISKLRAGEGVVFCPLALGVCFLEGESKEIQRFGRGCLIVKVRRKMTATTGKSVLSQDN